MRNSVELTLARLALRQLAGSRRSLWALVLALVPVLVAFPMGLASAGPEDAAKDFSELFQVLIVAVMLPIVALVVGTGIFGAEVEDGTLTYVLGKPVARWRIVLTRVVVAGIATAAVLVPSTVAAGVVAMRGAPGGGRGLIPAFAVAVAVGGLIYCALFVALSLRTRRALVAGLAYVVIWEGLLSRTFAGSRALSVREYTVSFAKAMAGPSEKLVTAQLDAGAAVPLAVAVGVLVTLYAVHRLRRMELGEAA